MNNFQVLEIGSDGSVVVYAEGLTKAKAVRIQQLLSKAEHTTTQWLRSMAYMGFLPTSSYVVEEVTL